jgi:hypothetical protein
VVSGFALNESCHAAIAVGASAVVAKPFSAEAFTKLIHSVLGIVAC